jgi:hypothetical protein
MGKRRAGVGIRPGGAVLTPRVICRHVDHATELRAGKRGFCRGSLRVGWYAVTVKSTALRAGRDGRCRWTEEALDDASRRSK